MTMLYRLLRNCSGWTEPEKRPPPPRSPRRYHQITAQAENPIIHEETKDSGRLILRCPDIRDVGPASTRETCKQIFFQPGMSSYINLECAFDLKALERFGALTEVSGDPKRNLGVPGFAAVRSKGFQIWIAIALLARIGRWKSRRVISLLAFFC